MALINRPMYEQFGARHLAVKGPGALTQLEEGVMGVLPLDMSADPAYWHIQGINAFSGKVTSGAGGAGTNAKLGISIENPSEEILARILKVWITTPTALTEIGVHRCARTAFSSAPGVLGHGIDTRIAEARTSQAILISNSDNTVPGTLLGAWNNAHIPLDEPFIVSPTESIYFRNTTPNAAMELTILWAEIPAYRAEL